MNGWRYLDLIVFRAYSDLRAETERTYLGFLWWILEPLLFMGVFYVVFGVLRGQPQTGFVSFLLVGLVIWQWFKSSLSHAGDSIRNHLYLMRQVRIQPWVIPLFVIAADVVKFGLVLVLLLVTLALTGHPPTTAWLALPLILLAELLLIVGLSLAYAAVVPFLLDLRFVMENLLLALMFLSGVFFSADEIPPPIKDWFFLNPVACLIDDSRQVLLQGQWPDWERLAAVTAVGLASCAVGLWLLAKLDRRYPKLAL
ncbi:MAG: transport permease protein [Lysobacteraceae bacterium]|nr:MAG: transport permease protein [Xanthomonadaceae bacterium]